MPDTLYGHRLAWCSDPKVHDEHSRFNQKTGETTMCPGTDLHEALMWEHERSVSQSDYND